jgi:acetyl esterase/lipase
MNRILSRLAPFALLSAALLLSSCERAYFRTLNAGVPANDSPSVVYDPAHGLSLDVYRTRANADPAPIVVFFYGGSWRSGERAYYRFVGEALSQRGVIVLIPDYRKAPAHPFPAFMDDAAAATAWARGHAAELGGDPSRIFLMGHSAGAHIAALLATDGRYLRQWQMQPRDLAGVIGLAGPYDFLPITEPAIREVFADPAKWPESQPVNFVDGDEPPFLLLQGDDDHRVNPLNSEHLAARLRAAGEPVRLQSIAGVGHVALVNGFRSPLFSPVLADSLDWINANGQPGLTPGRPAKINGKR